MKIREANIEDAENIKNVHLQAFDESEAQIVSDLAANLLKNDGPVKALSLVAMENNEIVGHVAFSPVFLESTNEHFAYILAPLAVSPKLQNKNIGSSLVEFGLDAISNLGTFIVFVYGDPQYYSRFGFKTESADKFVPPYTLQFSEGWQVMQLNVNSLPDGGKITCVDALNNLELW